eukprot:gnl/MRDRNA2_/MRDRNA2_89322_c0_seq1.p1 gnl/MRDRNA2_/MRDRNA2_89322_c0~~gnl/MRDRNA2_/MRDRNA2_89322_c0_seq1.p1  ORF type:complete len:542 (+),score=124.96 gnl/MRDRNA2_/MRDRNA2_89322_c0_seq1:74-1699(+)
MFSKADRKWKVQQGCELGVPTDTDVKKDDEVRPKKYKHTPYLQTAKEELNNFVAADDAIRRLVKQTSFDTKVDKALGHATDTLVKALVQEAEKSKYEYVTSGTEFGKIVSDSTSSDTTEAAKQTETRKSQNAADPSSTHIQAEEGCTAVVEGTEDELARVLEDSVESDAASPCLPVLVWQSSPSKKQKSFNGYHVKVEERKDLHHSGFTGYAGLVKNLELNRVVEVEPMLPADVKIVKRNGINLIMPTVSPVLANTDTITVTASDLQRCGNDLSLLRACMLKKSQEPGNILNITLHKRYGEKLGVSVEFEDLRITSFHEGGVFCMWNEHNPDQRVHIGSRILEANGKSEAGETLKELKDATYATTIDLKVECVEGEPEEIVEVKAEEEFVPYDPWAGKPVIPCFTQNDSHINQVWFPPSPEVSDDEDITPRKPGDRSRSGSCPPDPSRKNQRKPSLPPVNKRARPPSSRPSSNFSGNARDGRNGRSTSGSRDSSTSASSSRQPSTERRIHSGVRGANIPRSAPSSRPLSGCSSIEKLPRIP